MDIINLKASKYGDILNTEFMIMKKLAREGNRIVAYIGNKTGDIKASISDAEDVLKVGDVIKAEAVVSNILEINEFEILKEKNLDDFLPSIGDAIKVIMDEIEKISSEEFKSPQCIELNNYFFKNEAFVEKFKKGIGGVSQHHNYRGGLAEHTLNVMYLAKTLAYRYNCRNKEIAVLCAKLHDIGKTEELYVDGPFSYTLRGEMEGHIVIGNSMLEEAFKAKPAFYTQDFMERVKGCIIQHHGKLEFGSPKQPNMEESYIVHFADYVDAAFNKIGQIRQGVEPETWSPYDRRIEGKLYI